MVSSYRPLTLCCLASLSLTAAANTGHAAEPPKKEPSAETRSTASARASGREIFLREWIPNDPRSHGGDGLGPVFNESSCVSCHNQGGVGGGGSEAKNVMVISAIRTNVDQGRGRRLAPQVAPDGTTVHGDDAETGWVESAVKSIFKIPPAGKDAGESEEAKERRQLLKDLRKLHPGLTTSRSVVLHRSGTDPKYAKWRDRVLGLDMAELAPHFGAGNQPVAVPAVREGAGFFETLVAESQRQAIKEQLPPLELQAEKIRSLFLDQSVISLRGQQLQQLGSQPLSVAAIPTLRNSTALFGTGLIDTIPEAVLERAASRKFEDFPEISGRVARLKDGRIGRFGWKAQKASLYDFTMVACAVELGLHVPDHPQAGIPLRPSYVPAGFDLNRDECQDLVQFLRELPAPTRPVEQAPAIANIMKNGELAFAKIGCAACHTAELGEVAGIYSDLLLHDLGPELGDSGGYGVVQPQSSGNDSDDPVSGLLADSADTPIVRPLAMFAGSSDPATQVASLRTEERLSEKMIGAGRQEWRTAPLWGVRDSAPYMHDGRAGSLEQAIAFHGGEAQLSANRFFRLSPDERNSLLTFLRSLIAPDTLASAAN